MIAREVDKKAMGLAFRQPIPRVGITAEALIRLLRRFGRGGHALQFTVRHDSLMDRQDPIDIQIQAPNVGLEVDLLRIENFGRLRSRWAGTKYIGFDQESFFSQISHDDAIVVRIADDLIKLYRTSAVRQNHVVPHGLKYRLLFRFRETVRR